MGDDGMRTTPRTSEPPSPAPVPETRLWRIGRVIVGVVLIVIGILGCILPIIPGIPFLVAGVALIGIDHPLIRPFRERVERWRGRMRS
jgi:hypothetical protein